MRNPAFPFKSVVLLLGLLASSTKGSSIPNRLGRGAAVSAEEARALAEVKRFLAAGGDVNAELSDHDQLLGWPAISVTRLHRAAERGWMHVARFLLDHGANPKAVADTKSHYNQVTPIDVAFHTGHDELLLLLKKYALPPVGREVALWIELPGAGNFLPAVSFDDGTWIAITGDQKQRRICADILIDPGNRKITALTRRTGGFRHVGADAALASYAGRSWPENFRLPAGIQWRTGLQAPEIQQGKIFLVRSGSGAFFAVRIDLFDPIRNVFRLRYLRLGGEPESTPRSGSQPQKAPAAISYIQVATEKRAPSFLGLVCCVSQRGDAVALFGEPSREPNRTDAFWKNNPLLNRLGIAELGIRCSPDGVLERLQISFVSSVAYDYLRARLGLREPSWVQKGTGAAEGIPIRVHPEQGMMLVVQGGRVKLLMLYTDRPPDRGRAPPSRIPPDNAGRDRLLGRTQTVRPEATRELLAAIRAREIRKVLDLLAEGAPVNAADPETGQRALHIASRLGLNELLDLLIRNGADVNAADKAGATPLHVAALSGNAKTVGLLLTRGANPTLRDSDGLTPQDLAEDQSLAATLAEAADRYRRTAPAYRAVQRRLETYFRAIEHGDTESYLQSIAPNLRPKKLQPLKPLKIRYMVEKLEVSGRTARASVKVVYLNLPPEANTFTFELALELSPDRWGICGIRMKPAF